MQLKPSELSENLNKSGGYIPGVRPGKETEEYVKKVLKRINLLLLDIQRNSFERNRKI